MAQSRAIGSAASLTGLRSGAGCCVPIVTLGAALGCAANRAGLGISTGCIVPVVGVDKDQVILGDVGTDIVTEGSVRFGGCLDGQLAVHIETTFCQNSKEIIIGCSVRTLCDQIAAGNREVICSDRIALSIGGDITAGDRDIRGGDCPVTGNSNRSSADGNIIVRTDCLVIGRCSVDRAAADGDLTIIS